VVSKTISTPRPAKAAAFFMRSEESYQLSAIGPQPEEIKCEIFMV
jgi:hypothetical protein